MDEKPSIVAAFEHYDLRILGPDRGGWRKCQCPLPLHEDMNPSASLNEDGERWFCHTCDLGGDAYDIVTEREGLHGASFADVKRRTEELFGAPDGSSRGTTRRDGALPRRQGHRPGRRRGSPPWLRIG